MRLTVLLYMLFSCRRVPRYFSYEHFYVVYCKFWELDSDHDFSLDRNDLARYANCALTYQIVERIFEEVRRSLSYMRCCVSVRCTCLVADVTDDMPDPPDRGVHF
jgi:hypothetical protein